MPEAVAHEHLVAAARDLEGPGSVPEWSVREGVDVESLAGVCMGLLDSIVDNARGEADAADPHEAAALGFLTGAILGVKAARAAGREADR